jgi:hypothetical protein
MSLAVRPASLVEDREKLIVFLERSFPKDPMRALFKWRYESNPAGPGWSWVVYDNESGAIRAMTSLFPRPMYVDGEQVMCGQVAEFAVDKAYRSLGPAIMLQRATFEPVDAGMVAFCYDCPPHDTGMATFVRLGMRSSCELTRYVLPLRSDEILEKRLGKGVWTKPLTEAANLVLSMRRMKRHRPGVEIETLEGRFGDEFSYLDKIVPSAGIIRSCRSAELLNWRFCDRFESNVEVLVARKSGDLLAFLAFIVSPEKRASILDLFGRNLADTGLTLIDAATEICHRRNVTCMEGYCSDASELKPLFESARFRARETAARVVAHAKSDDSGGSILNRSIVWPLGAAELNA